MCLFSLILSIEEEQLDYKLGLQIGYKQNCEIHLSSFYFFALLQ